VSIYVVAGAGEEAVTVVVQGVGVRVLADAVPLLT
jgi:hypothetical protein